MQRLLLHSRVHDESQVEDCMEAENMEAESRLMMVCGSIEGPKRRMTLRDWLLDPGCRSSVTRPGDLVFPAARTKTTEKERETNTTHG